MNSILIDAVIFLDIDPNATRNGEPCLPLEKFLGRSAIQRLLYQLGQIEAKCCMVIANNESPGVLGMVSGQASEIDLGQMIVDVCTSKRTTPMENFADQVIVLQANTVLDIRFFRKIKQCAAPVKIFSDDGPPFYLAKVHADQITQIVGAEGDLGEYLVETPDMTNIPTSTIPKYVPSMRRSFPPYRQMLDDISDLELAGDKVMDAAQKGVLDFPARYLHPVPENYLARALSGTSITPNQITIYSAILAFIGTYLFATQWYLPALILAVIAGILDGVDGKLARIKLLSSPYGDRLDHTLDISFEFSWYIALAWGLSQGTGDPGLFWYGFVIIGIMLLARGLSGTYLYLTGRQIHDHTGFDRAVRLFAGRRNIYVLVLLAGYLTNNFLESFKVVALWAAVTAGIYGIRNIIAILHKLYTSRGLGVKYGNK
ncbi:CDP-alcohol phosphatidyltransferase family protein [Pseudomonadota bacterium]